MSRFKCKNEECTLFEKEVTEVKAVYKFIDGKLVCDNLKCPRCGEDREEIKEDNGFQINIQGNNKRKWRLSTKGTIY